MSILAGIGNTPMVELTSMNPNRRVRILCKLEGNNPGGSVKDRPAYYMIKEAEKSGQLTHDKIILEPTSGNTGIALAMIGAAKGYKVELCMPGCVSMERKGILEAYGATVILTPAQGGHRRGDPPRPSDTSTTILKNTTCRISSRIPITSCRIMKQPALKS